jgi:hypothetical protein
MTTTENPGTSLRIPARELRTGDVISMGTIKTATPGETGDGRTYVSIVFETRIGIHGTAFPPDLEVTVFSRAGQLPMTLNDVVTALTELAEEWDLIVASHRRIAGEKGEYDTDGHALLSQADERAQCVTAVRGILARFQPVSFDTYCAWCQQDWTEHVGGKPGVPGGPSTCPPVVKIPKIPNMSGQQQACGKSWKAEIALCPECRRPSIEHQS